MYAYPSTSGYLAVGKYTNLRTLKSVTSLQCHHGEEGCLGFEEGSATLYQDRILLTSQLHDEKCQFIFLFY